jgi:hypothetical protein
MRPRAGLWAPFHIDSAQSAFPGHAHANTRDQENSMLDIVMLALGLGFFAVAVGYTYACERL